MKWKAPTGWWGGMLTQIACRAEGTFAATPISSIRAAVKVWIVFEEGAMNCRILNSWSRSKRLHAERRAGLPSAYDSPIRGTAGAS